MKKKKEEDGGVRAAPRSALHFLPRLTSYLHHR